MSSLPHRTSQLTPRCSVRLIYAFLVGVVKMGLFASLLNLLPGCALGDANVLRPNIGDQIAGRLKLGMTNADIDAAVADLRERIEHDRPGLTIDSEQEILQMYKQEYFPKDVLNSIKVGTQCRSLSYWTNYAGGQMQGIVLFFDDRTKLLRGWVNYPSAYSRDKFMHERLTSMIRIQSGNGRGMTHDQVYSLIGAPSEIIVPPEKRSRSQYEDHFWHTYMTQTPPILGVIRELEVYSYVLENGQRRRVYLGYYPAAKNVPDELALWGYDHAWEEAERYERERKARSQ